MEDEKTGFFFMQVAILLYFTSFIQILLMLVVELVPGHPIAIKVKTRRGGRAFDTLQAAIILHRQMGVYWVWHSSD